MHLKKPWSNPKGVITPFISAIATLISIVGFTI